jgi:hypothetical protein
MKRDIVCGPSSNFMICEQGVVRKDHIDGEAIRLSGPHLLPKLLQAFHNFTS